MSERWQRNFKWIVWILIGILIVWKLYDISTKVEGSADSMIETEVQRILGEDFTW